VPVIASRGGGVDELVASGGGILVPPGQALPVAEVISQLWRHPGERLQRSQAARQLALQTFDVEKHVDEWIEVYQSLAGGSR
jgi:glycosyltransferase involved in cell wall biosynthesis